MTRKFSQPPLLILLDLLFILIFSLILDNKSINIEIPKDKLFEGAVLVLKEDGILYELNKFTYKKEKILNSDDNYIYFQSCDTQCKNAPKNISDKIYIYFPNNLFNNISKLTFLGMHTSYKCTNINFKILNNGKIDMMQLLKDNPCLEQIGGLEDYRVKG